MSAPVTRGWTTLPVPLIAYSYGSSYDAGGCSVTHRVWVDVGRALRFTVRRAARPPRVVMRLKGSASQSAHREDHG